MVEKEKIYKEKGTGNNEMFPSDPYGSLDDFFSEKTLFFIDAGFLSKLSKHFGKGDYVKFKIKDFVKKICSKESVFPKKVFYYTAPPYQSSTPNKREIEKKENYDRFKHSLVKEGVIFREGRIQRLKIDNKFIYKQKGVDTLLTIDLSHIKEDYPLVKKIILVSSDTDFVPVIEDIKNRKIEVILYTYFDRIRGSPFSLSNHLLKSSSRWIKLKEEDLYEK